ISTKGVLTSAGSRILENYIPIFDATVVERISEEDTIILGKVKVKEFGLTPTKNVSKALSHKGAIWGLSTSQDSRKFSLKPTFGMISRYGVIGARSTFDQIVPITNSIEDMGAVLNSIVEYDQRDSTSIDMDKVDYTKALNTNIEGLKIAIPMELFTEDHSILLYKTIEKLEKLGAIVQKISLETLKYVLPVYKILSSAEFASNAARYDGISLGYRAKEYIDREELYKKSRAEGFGKEAKQAILFGNYALSSGQYEKYYKKAQRVRAMIKEELTTVTKEYGLLILPFTSGDKEEPYNLIGNITGLPSLTMPGGLQIIGENFKEEELLKLAYVFENEVIKEVEKDA
ncbi:MAG: hypothetical protein GX053_00015, partial [Tissierella sp.]|nr:hypothetical protein [Tissierella sp.]